MALYAGTGPVLARAVAYQRGSNLLATIYSDVGMTTETDNPFTIQPGGEYSFYGAADVYVAVGVLPSLYEEGPVQTSEEYMAPDRFPRGEPYHPTNVTELRTADFSSASASDVRSLLGTLIQDLKASGAIR